MSQQIYLVEIFVDKVVVYTDDTKASPKKNLILIVQFGPKIEFIFKEGQLAKSTTKKDDVIELTEKQRRQWSRTMRVGKSCLFPSYPETMLNMLQKCPLELGVWTDDDKEPPNKEYVGQGTMFWHTQFFHYLKGSVDPTKKHGTLTMKEITVLNEECCCSENGEVHLILRLSALGQSIETDFQQILKDPERFVFKTDKGPSMYECKRIEVDDPKYDMTTSLYNVLHNPKDQDEEPSPIICTQFQSCAVSRVKSAKELCEEEFKPKPFPMDKIRMGDIKGPCGNVSCPLAHKVRMYIRNMDAYKTKAGKVSKTKADVMKKICGTCSCHQDTFNRENLAPPVTYSKCAGCEGKAKTGDTCEDRADKLAKADVRD